MSYSNKGTGKSQIRDWRFQTLTKIMQGGSVKYPKMSHAMFIVGS